MSSRRRAFTLVELLVVVGIVAVLVGLLMPALSRAREQARAVQCASNIRQVAMAMALYEADYRVFPYCSDPSYGAIRLPDGSQGDETWVAALVYGRYLGGTNFPASDLGVLACPSVAEGRRKLERRFITWSPDYGYNWYANRPRGEFRDPKSFFGQRARMQKDAARKILLTEAWAMTGSVTFTDPPVFQQSPLGHGCHVIGHAGWGNRVGGPVLDLRHMRGRAINVAFMAGNVELVFPRIYPQDPSYGENHPFAPDRFMYTGG